jgi:hypothetical protein
MRLISCLWEVLVTTFVIAILALTLFLWAH